MYECPLNVASVSVRGCVVCATLGAGLLPTAPLAGWGKALLAARFPCVALPWSHAHGPDCHVHLPGTQYAEQTHQTIGGKGTNPPPITDSADHREGEPGQVGVSHFPPPAPPDD